MKVREKVEVPGTGAGNARSVPRSGSPSPAAGGARRGPRAAQRAAERAGELRRAVRALRSSDPVLADIITRVGPCRLEVRSEGTHFGAVLRAIIYQQLSGKAAATIHGRVAALYGGRVPSPALLLATADSELRFAGLSRQKLDYLRSLAGRCADGSIPLARLSRLTDDEIIDRLTEVRGVGRWTAQMFLMSRLGRLDVLPDLDLGIQRGLQVAYALPTMPKPAEVLQMGEKWRPYRSVASWYLWRVADGDVAL